VPFVPLNGPEGELFLDDAVSNQALIDLRRFIINLIERFEPDTPQIWAVAAQHRDVPTGRGGRSVTSAVIGAIGRVGSEIVRGLLGRIDLRQ
jgi:hypothetical protein